MIQRHAQHRKERLPLVCRERAPSPPTQKPIQSHTFSAHHRRAPLSEKHALLSLPLPLQHWLPFSRCAATPKAGKRGLMKRQCRRRPRRCECRPDRRRRGDFARCVCVCKCVWESHSSSPEKRHHHHRSVSPSSSSPSSTNPPLPPLTFEESHCLPHTKTVVLCLRSGARRRSLLLRHANGSINAHLHQHRHHNDRPPSAARKRAAVLLCVARRRSSEEGRGEEGKKREGSGDGTRQRSDDDDSNDDDDGDGEEEEGGLRRRFGGWSIQRRCDDGALFGEQHITKKLADTSCVEQNATCLLYQRNASPPPQPTPISSPLPVCASVPVLHSSPS